MRDRAGHSERLMIDAASRTGRDEVSGCCVPDDGAAATARVLIDLLRQLDGFVGTLSEEVYTQAPVGPSKSSIGQHVRHSLDHFDALLAHKGDGPLDYDARERGTAIETNRGAARRLMERVCGELMTIAERSGADRALLLSAQVTGRGDRVTVGSSLGRELVFALSHTIHHNALIAFIAAMLGVATPVGFGYAPATITHLERLRCAQ